MTNNRKHLLFACLCLIWGTTWLAIRLTVADLPPLTGASIRFILATVCVFLFAKSTKVDLKLPGLSAHVWMILCALLVYVIDYGLIYWAEQHISAGVTAIFFATFPLFTSLFGFWLLPDKELSRIGVWGILLGFIGILIVFYDQLFVTHFQTTILLASLAVVLAAMAAGLATVLVKKRGAGISAVSITFHQLLWGTLGLSVLALIFDPLPRTLPSSTALLAIAYLGIIGTSVAFIIYYRLLQYKSAVSISTLAYITPLVAVLLDFFVYGTLLPIKTWLGLCVVFAGIYLVNKSPTTPHLAIKKIEL